MNTSEKIETLDNHIDARAAAEAVSEEALHTSLTEVLREWRKTVSAEIISEAGQ